LEKDLSKAHFLMRLTAEGPELQVVYRDRPPIPLPALDSKEFAEQLASKLKAVHRARSLIEIGASLERDRSRVADGHDVKIEVVGHRDRNDPGRVLERPPTGWVFLPGDRISFRITNTSKTKRLEVTLLVVSLDYKIFVFHPARNQINKVLEPGASLNTRAGDYTGKPPFGAEQMIAIITSPTNPAVNYGLLTQPGITQRGYTAKSPVAQLLERGMYGVGSRSGLQVSELDDQGARVLTWRTEPASKK